MRRLPFDLVAVAAANPVPRDAVVGERMSAGARELRERLVKSSTTEETSGRPHRRIAHKRMLVLVAAALLLPAAAVGGITAWSVFAPSEAQLKAERGGSFVPDSFRVLRSLEEPAGITWTVVTYKTTKYECLDIYGGITDVAELEGAVGGCGLPAVSDDQVIVGGLGGGLSVGANFFSVTGGRVASRVASVRATFADGSTAVDHPVGGIWMFVGSPDRSPVRVEALDGHGDVLAILPL